MEISKEARDQFGFNPGRRTEYGPACFLLRHQGLYTSEKFQATFLTKETSKSHL
jgi:hypothetical protein